MKIKGYNSWIAIIFLIVISLLPILTILKIQSPQSVVETAADTVLTGNGTAADKVGMTESDDLEEQEGKASEASETLPGEHVQKRFEKVQDSISSFTEKLAFRNTFIWANSKLTRAMTGGSYMESTQVLLGKENWLFYKTQNDGYPIYDYMGINHFTEEEMAAMAANLVLARDYFEKERSVAFVATSIPNKEIIYEEFMPDTIARINTVSRGEQFAQYMKEHTDVRYVYPKQAFLQYKQTYPLFYKTDTHWNHIGAFVGVQEIFKELYGDGETPENVLFHETQKDFAGDLAVIAGVAKEYAIDTVYEFDASDVDESRKHGGNAIVVGDSFGGFLSVVAKGYYENVYWIDTDDFKVSMLDEYHADVIIWESVERLQEVFMQESLLD